MTSLARLVTLGADTNDILDNPVCSSVYFTCAVPATMRKYIIVYRMSGDRFSIRLLNLVTIFSVRYNDISEVKVISLKEAFGLGLFALRMGNKMFGKIVMIRKPMGLTKEILISPDDHEKFVQELSDKIRASR